ncbi:MAG: SDR family oxidoreductase [Hyphomicrobiaceae bacterium]|nr:SDR family oxidoreductase [Hyphomicrobiaceae bacterium]
MERKVAIVTGGSRGIGAATAQCLGREGWAVAVNYRANDAAAEETSKAVVAAGGLAMTVRGDTASEDDVTRIFNAVEAEWGRLDGLVNNAGIVGPLGRFDALTRDDMEHVLAVNVTGYMLCARAAVKRMSTKYGGNGGVIVNVSSGSARSGGANRNILYAVSKGAVNSLTIGLSQEVAGEGIRVNTVSPGLTRTDMTSAGIPEPEFQARESAIPAGRAGEPDEIAEGIVWLMSEAATYVAGANLRIAGGRP